MPPPLRVCVIGAGPCGLSLMHQMAKEQIEENKEDLEEVVCYEKQGDLGGQWNFTWRTGIGEGGENVHCSMYRHLWINGPKESHEYADYTFDNHFGRSLPSYIPRELMLDYIKGRFGQHDLRSHIRFFRVVSRIVFDESSKRFSVFTRDVSPGCSSHEEMQREQPEEVFDYVVNCTGHFSVPDVPTFEGMSTFPGRVFHSHDFRNPREFAGQNVLVVGAFKSAEDISVVLVKFGVKSVTISYRSRPMGVKWPEGIEERPLLTRVEGSKVHFKDGTSRKVDSIILCTGYLHHYPHLPPDLRLTGPNSFYPDRLYKGIVWMGQKDSEILSCHGRLLYLGAQKEFSALVMNDIQALWAVKWMRGLVGRDSVGKEEMEADVGKWRKREAALDKNDHEQTYSFHLDYMNLLSEEVGYLQQEAGGCNNTMEVGYLEQGGGGGCNNTLEVRYLEQEEGGGCNKGGSNTLEDLEEFSKWLRDFREDVTGYRDRCFASRHTGKVAATPKVKYMDYVGEVDVGEFVAMYE